MKKGLNQESVKMTSQDEQTVLMMFIFKEKIPVKVAIVQEMMNDKSSQVIFLND